MLIQPDLRRAPRGSALADSNGAPFFQIILSANDRKKISHAGRCGRYDADDASNRLFRPAAEIVDQAYLAAGLAGEAGVAAVQDQPVMRVQHELRRNHALEAKLHLERRIARGQACSIADPKHVRVHRHGVFANAMLSTTLAVLRPAPGSDSSSLRVRGTSPPNPAISFSDSAMTFFALLR